MVMLTVVIEVDGKMLGKRMLNEKAWDTQAEKTSDENSREREKVILFLCWIVWLSIDRRIFQVNLPLHFPRTLERTDQEVSERHDIFIIFQPFFPSFNFEDC